MEASVVGHKVADLETRFGKVDCFNKALDDEVGDLSNTAEDLETNVERMDNSQHTEIISR